MCCQDCPLERRLQTALFGCELLLCLSAVLCLNGCSVCDSIRSLSGLVIVMEEANSQFETLMGFTTPIPPNQEGSAMFNICRASSRSNSDLITFSRGRKYAGAKMRKTSCMI